MRKYNVLCLTEHAKHSKENSLYAISASMAGHPLCEELVIASRSNESNHEFFQGLDFDKLHVSLIDDQFDFQNGNDSLSHPDKEISPADYDIIFLRLPRPTSDEFLEALENNFQTACFVNSPSGIIKCSNKAALVNFEDVCPPMKLCNSIEDIIEFSKHHDLVLKPLREYGGKGIIRIKNNILNDGKQDYPIAEYLKKIEPAIINEGFLAMKYLENVSQGDKRLIVIGGEVLAASLRLPAEESWLCNVALGGKSVESEVDEDELKIINSINPFLEKNGILIYGADTLVDDNGKRTLSEVNALSIGGFPQAEKQTGKPIIKITLDKIFSYADVHYQQ